MNEQPKSSWVLPTIVAVAVGSVLAVVIFSRVMLYQVHVDPGYFFGGAVPARLQTLLSLKIEGGKLAEFFDPVNQHKIALVYAERETSGVLPLAVGSIIDRMDKERLGNGDYQAVAPVLFKYLGAQFNVLSAADAAATEFLIGNAAVPAERFNLPKGAHYLAAVLNLRGGQLLVLAMKKGSAVDSTYVGQILNAMPLVQERTAASAP